MNIDIHDHKQLLSHLLLNNRSVVREAAETKEWKENGVLKATVYVNGVEIPAEVLESTLQRLMEHVEKHYVDKYSVPDIDNMVEEKAKALLKEHADNALEKIYNLTRVLEDAEDQLKSPWER